MTDSNPFKQGITTSAIVKAIQFLRAAKCDFFIVKDGQVVMDTFPKRADPTMPPPRIRQRIPTPEVQQQIQRRGRYLFDFVTPTNYARLIENLVPMTPLLFKRSDYPILHTKDAWTSFMASVQSKARRFWGSDNVVVDRNADQGSITVMRIDPQASVEAPARKAPARKAPARKAPARAKSGVNIDAVHEPVQVVVQVAGKKSAVKKPVAKSAAKSTARPAPAPAPAPALPPAATPKKARRRARRNFSDTGYTDKVRAMQPGETLEFLRDNYESTRKSNAAWMNFAVAAMTLARRIFPDQTVHEFKGSGGTLRILRVKP